MKGPRIMEPRYPKKVDSKVNTKAQFLGRYLPLLSRGLRSLSRLIKRLLGKKIQTVKKNGTNSGISGIRAESITPDHPDKAVESMERFGMTVFSWVLCVLYPLSLFIEGMTGLKVSQFPIIFCLIGLNSMTMIRGANELVRRLCKPGKPEA